MKMLFRLLLLILTFGVMLAACGDPEDGSKAGASVVKPPANRMKLGEKVTVADTWAVTVNAVRTTTGDRFFKPHEKNVFVVINVNLQNIGKKVEKFNRLFYFSLRTSDNKQANIAFVPNTKALPEGNIQAGAVVKGDLNYEAPADQKQLTLTFQPNAAVKRISWDIAL